MPFKPVILWTDGLIFLLLASVVWLAWKARARPPLMASWRRVTESRSGMAAAVVLVAFVAIGLLDSLHFRPVLQNHDGETGEFYSVEVLSLLDVIARPLKERVEKTYSAPFATHLYTKEAILLPDGRQVRDYPRLKYGGAHLADPQRDLAGDIARKAVKGALAGMVLGAALSLLVVRWVSRRETLSMGTAARRILRGDTRIPWLVILVTAGLLILVGAMAVELSLYYHIFGTDKVGQDVFYQSLKSVRTGLMIGTLTTLVMLPFALLLGIMAGYFRGWVDDLIQYLYTTLSSIPGVLLIAASVLILQGYIDRNPDSFDNIAARADLRLLFLCIILGITSWTGLCRLLRGETLKLCEMDYVQAAVAFGVGHWRIITRHILPNVMHIILISVVMDFSGLVLAEAVLSYIGVGVDPTMQSWGNMINGARLEMAREPMVWWQLAAAFVLMFVLVLSANLFSDAVQKAFDPRMRSR
jgi:peptide/nickel transport system permease protein